MNFPALTRLLSLAVVPALAAAEFPPLYNSETEATPRLSPSEAAAGFQLPPGFRAGVFAAEPDVQNPIALAWDGRGRLWIAENFTYAEAKQKFDLGQRDRVLIFTDRDGDGRFDERKVFTDEVQMLTSVEVGLGGVWLMCPPQLLFVPDRNGDDRPDGAAEVVLDGFTVPPENYHNFANGLRFGPDGWLYGRCGASSPGEVGRPGTPAGQRIPLRGGLWRYHPQLKRFESLTGGTTNPWGHDWDRHGELFFINTVNGHLWHAFPGAHYVRPHTIDPNPHTYGLINQHADHWHFDTGKSWMDSRDGKADAYGGGHAHIGMMIYQGDNWPAEYRGRLFTWNMHGRRANQELLERRGSGYVGRHGTDSFASNDRWFRGMELSYGPDGGVLAIDWSDTGECHERSGVHRESGRIYKFTHGETRPVVGLDLPRLSDDALLGLHTHANEWFVRQARLELARRAAEGRLQPGTLGQLRARFQRGPDEVQQLRLLWTLHSIGGADEAFLRAQLAHAGEHVRAWAVRLLTDRWPLDTTLSRRSAADDPAATGRLLPELVRLGRQDSSALVRLVLASTLQRLPVSQRAALAEALVARAEDASDHNLPQLIWYGLIPLGEQHLEQLAQLAARCELPLTRRHLARRLAESLETQPNPLNHILATATKQPAAVQLDFLTGLAEALRGWRKAPKPAAWDTLAAGAGRSGDEKLVALVRELSVVFGDGRALDDVKQLALNKDADLASRKAALQTLIDSRPPDLRAICEQLLSVRFLNPVAARGLAQFDDPAIGDRLVKAYKGFHHSERPQLLATLVSRPSFARSLLEAISGGVVPREDLSAFHARQIRSFNDEKLNQRLGEVWGQLRDTDADKQRLLAQWKQRLTPAVLAQADKAAGRQVFGLVCANCHRLYGEGGQIGPDLTGAGRDNLDYVLENLIDPSGVVNADYRMSVIELKDGRVLNGVIRSRTARTLTTQTMTEQLTLELADVVKVTESTLSLMPEGLVEALSEEQIRNLVAYLMHRSQVPLPAGP